MIAERPSEANVGSHDSSPRNISSIEERFVWWLWQSRRFDSAAARKIGFDIIFPGWFSTSAGPDFRDAVIADAFGVIRRGDVELHLVEHAWRDHGHDVDPAYDNVIAHVVLWRSDGGATCTSAGYAVPVLALELLLDREISELVGVMGEWRPAVVHCPAHQIAPAGLRTRIVEAGEEHVRSKVNRMVANVEALGAERALYLDLAESLGYSANRAAFRKLADALPFELLAGLTVFDSEKLLLAAAGLAPVQDLMTTFIDGSVLQPDELVTFRVRPSNNPVIRLRGLARLIDANRRGLVQLLTSTPLDSLWQQFCITADTVLVGRSRADDIVLNVAVPFLVAYAGLDVRGALEALPAPSGNRWVDSLRRHLNRTGLTLRPYRAIHHAGLQELSLRFCRFDHCEACPLHASDNPLDAGED